MATILGICFLLNAITTATPEVKTISVTTDIGVINKFVEEVTFLGKSTKIHKYLGIPFAEPPVGVLRFKKPVPKPPLEGPLDAFRHRSSCSQINLGFFHSEKITYEEDCLYLNIYTPQQHTKYKKLPVMVWIYGGGFVVGCSDMYIGDNLATHGDVIVVTLNYRLSVWGFLTTGDQYARGNYGLWDQHLAIKWVHDNIAAFGGDTNRVTLFGESAGSASVMYQGLYPGNKGLFQRVIGQSGSVGAFWSTNKDDVNNAKRLGSLVGCGTEDSEALVTCLREVSSEQLEKIVSNVNHGFVAMPFPFIPTTDGEIVTTNPKETFSRNTIFPSDVREFFSSLDVLTGVNAVEGSMGLQKPYFAEESPEEFLPNRTYFEETLVPRLVKACFEEPKAAIVTDAVIAEYTNWENPEDPFNIRNEYTSMWGDASFTGDLYKTLNTHAKLSSSQHTYMYLFDIEPAFLSYLLPVSWFTKMGHEEDLPFVFGFKNPDSLEEEYHVSPTPWEERLSADVMTIFSNFAKTGNPNSPEDLGLDWLPYTRKHKHYLQISRDMTSSNVKQRWNTKRANFWANLLPEMIKSTQCEETNFHERLNKDTCDNDQNCSP